MIENLQEYVDPDTEPIYFIPLPPGDSPGFAHIAQDDTGAMATFIDTTLWDAGLRATFATEGRWYESPQQPKPLPKGPTRKLYDYLALCRVHVNQRPSQVLGNIAAAFALAVERWRRLGFTVWLGRALSLQAEATRRAGDLGRAERLRARTGDVLDRIRTPARR